MVMGLRNNYTSIAGDGPSFMRDAGQDILVGIDAGTSVIKAIAFDLAGRQIAASVPNHYTTRPMARPFNRWTRPGPIAHRRCVISAQRSKAWRSARGRLR